MRLLSSILIGVGITLFLLLVEAGYVLLFNPADMLGRTTQRLLALLTLPIHVPLVLLILVLELIVVVGLILLVNRPFAIYRYLRVVRDTQEEYHKLYTPLTALTNIRKSLDTTAVQNAQNGQTSPTVAIEEERVSMLDLVQKSNAHQMILGVPGAGKTTALRVYQYVASRHIWHILLKRDRIPLYIPMKNYSLFLKERQRVGTGNTMPLAEVATFTLLDFLQESDLPAITYLRPYLRALTDQGRLLLLCDGLNEVDGSYLEHIDRELVYFMLNTRNRVVMTCREVDYREQEDFVKLVDEGHAARAVVYPLQPDQINQFVERYVERQDKSWLHTAGQIIQVIDRSRLRYHCTNPMMLFTLMGIIDKIGVERGKQIDTRGRLLREYVKQLISKEQHQPKWSKAAPNERDVIRFLGEVACAARWANDRNAIQLHISAATTSTGGGAVNFEELADELGFWLDEHPALGPFVSDDENTPANEPYTNMPQLLQFALNAALIDVSPSGVLSFRHELIAEYFVAEYFYASDVQQRSSASQVREELLDNVGRWSEPVAIWAGLLDNPLDLAEQFGVLGSNNPAYILQALALSLVCVGVLWTPPQAEIKRTVMLPTSVANALSIAVRNKAAREELAHIFTRCAEEGGQEVYRSLLPLVMVEGVDELLTLLDKSVVPDLLFTQLEDAVDDVAYEAQVRRITQVLGRFGAVVVEHAVQLSQPAPERSVRLRAAAINVLGGTHERRAVEPLIARLSDAESAIISRAATSLSRLGPPLVLAEVIRELESHAPSPLRERIHRATLIILTRFLEEQDPRRQLSMMQYQLVVDKVVPVLTSNYESEPEVQQLAHLMLVKQGQILRENCAEQVIAALTQYLSSQDVVAVNNVIRVLQEIGSVATPYLLNQLQDAAEPVRLHILEIVQVTRDVRVLPSLLQMVDETTPLVQQQVTKTLKVYAPESVPGLVELVLHGPNDMVAAKAAHILGEMGKQVVVPITDTIEQIVPGRTRLLVQVLEQIHEPQTISALVSLLYVSQQEPLLTIAVVRALSKFTDRQVVPALLMVLNDTYPQVYEEAIDALSALGIVALDDLIAALDSAEETPLVQRVRRAILGMSPFPGDQLVNALAHCTDQQAQQLLFILQMQGAEAAQVLTRNLLHADERVRAYVYGAIEAMPGAIVVPALLEVLQQPGPLRKVASSLLLNYPESAISPLVDLLGEHERGDAAASILPLFGPVILRPLISGLEDHRTLGRERAQNIIVSLVRQTDDKQAILSGILHLLHPTPPPRAHEVLLGVLTGELAAVSIPVLLEGLEDAHLLGEAADALVRVYHRTQLSKKVLDSLLESLYVEDRRGGAETAFIQIGAPAVPVVGALLTDEHPLVVRGVKRILRDIGVPALPFIWNAYSNADNPALREAAMDVFHSMPTEVVKNELVRLLTSDERNNIAMAVALLLERIHDESVQQYADHNMVQALLGFVQQNDNEATNLRIISLLLLLGDHRIIDPLLQEIEATHRKQLTYMLLLLGAKAQSVLLGVLKDANAKPELRAEVASVMAMLSTDDIVTEYARNVSNYGMASTRTSVLFPEQLSIALRSLGGLLASGQWDAAKLREMRNANQEGSPAHELFSILLGWRYAPELQKLEQELQTERDTYKKELLSLSAQVMMDNKRMQSLEEELDELKREHGFRGDELQQTVHEKDSLQRKIEQLAQERNSYRSQLERAQNDSQKLRDQNEQLLWQLNQMSSSK